jgi:uncharacterized small protein (DUF1192 family)
MLGEELQRAKAGVAELAAELKVKDIMMQAKDDMLKAKDREMSLLAQAKDREMHTKDLLLQAKDREISLLHADIARLNAESAAVGASRQPAPPASCSSSRCCTCRNSVPRGAAAVRGAALQRGGGALGAGGAAAARALARASFECAD